MSQSSMRTSTSALVSVYCDGSRLAWARAMRSPNGASANATR
jgi:hypothetical protein